MKGQALVENVHEADEFEDISDCNLRLRVRYVALVQLVSTARRLAVGRERAGADRSTVDPLSVAGVARRHNRRAAYGYGAGVVGAGLAAGAIGAAATSPYGYYGGGPYVGTGRGYYGGTDVGATNGRLPWGAIITAITATLAAITAATPTAVTSPDDQRWFRATMAARAGETRAFRSEVVSYYAGGPYSRWGDYEARNSVACTHGTRSKPSNEANKLVRGLDVIMNYFAVFG